MASIRLARIAPMIDARTMSKSPALSATSAMIISGALPKVALRRPPMASPVRVASCSVDSTIKCAIGTIDRPAEKNKTGSGTWAYSSASVTGMNANSQLIDGLKETAGSVFDATTLLMEVAHNREEERGGPSAHQDAGQRFDAAGQPPVVRQQDVAVTGGRIGDRTEIERRLHLVDGAFPEIHQRPHRDFEEVQHHDPDGDHDEQPRFAPERPRRACDERAQVLERRRHAAGVDDHADCHKGAGDQQSCDHRNIATGALTKQAACL